LGKAKEITSEVERARLAVKMFDALSADDQEESHARADNLLLAFLKAHSPEGKNVAKAYERARKRIGFWYA
jgi:hypothetical protein